MRCRGRGVCGGIVVEKGEMRLVEEKVCVVGDRLRGVGMVVIIVDME